VSGRDPWEYPDFALSVLCKDCHYIHHNSELATLPFERILDNFGCKNPSQITNTEEVSDYAKSCINRSSVDSFHEWLHYAVEEHHMKID
jgi:hypothetical protein